MPETLRSPVGSAIGNPIFLDKEKRRLDTEHFAKPFRLFWIDSAFSVECFVDMAALVKDRQQVSGSLAGMFHEELKTFGGCAVVRRHTVAAVVVLNQKAQQPHQFGFIRRARTAFADEIA